MSEVPVTLDPSVGGNNAHECFNLSTNPKASSPVWSYGGHRRLLQLSRAPLREAVSARLWHGLINRMRWLVLTPMLWPLRLPC
jgi:hypothetical protein